MDLRIHVATRSSEKRCFSVGGSPQRSVFRLMVSPDSVMTSSFMFAAHNEESASETCVGLLQCWYGRLPVATCLAILLLPRGEASSQRAGRFWGKTVSAPLLSTSVVNGSHCLQVIRTAHCERREKPVALLCECTMEQLRYCATEHYWLSTQLTSACRTTSARLILRS